MKPKSWMVQVAEYSQLAFLLPATALVGYVVGHLLDRAFGTGYLTLVFLLLGIVAGIVKLIQQVQRDFRNDQ
ncbi:MAG: AtpZ/AtpI family protein [Bryobacterales bacterium]|nr:AtpZ/AtpI family protein [Bryobacterales bacterium]